MLLVVLASLSPHAVMLVTALAALTASAGIETPGRDGRHCTSLRVASALEAHHRGTLISGHFGQVSLDSGGQQDEALLMIVPPTAIGLWATHIMKVVNHLDPLPSCCSDTVGRGCTPRISDLPT